MEPQVNLDEKAPTEETLPEIAERMYQSSGKALELLDSLEAELEAKGLLEHDEEES